MRVVFALLACLACLANAEMPVMRESLIAEINHRQTSFVAGFNSRFTGWSVSRAKAFMGSKLEEGKIAHGKLPKYSGVVLSNDELPSSLDWTTKMPNCTVISSVRDQAACGSCWAFGSSEAFNSRKCIKTNGAFDTMLSAQDVASCCNLFNGCFGSQGCNGGIPSEAWNYMQTKGIVSGGDYDTIGEGKTCFPYQLPNCEHHVSGPYPACGNEGPTPACPNQQCTEKTFPKSWDDDLTHAASTYSLNSVQEIMSDMAQNGPVTAAFSVYEDFLTYKSGVYKHTTGSYLGGHAISIVGYGTLNGEDYWKVKNSWNPTWGDKGYFLIARGVDECGIEDQVVAGSA